MQNARSAAEISEVIMKEGIIPVRFVAADSVYGESDNFLRAAEAHVGLTYFVEISCDRRCQLRQPCVGTETYRYEKENRSKKVVAEGEKSPVRADILAKGIHEVFRYRRTVSEGSR